jgi:hypothetical protein
MIYLFSYIAGYFVTKILLSFYPMIDAKVKFTTKDDDIYEFSIAYLSWIGFIIVIYIIHFPDDFIDFDD